MFVFGGKGGEGSIERFLQEVEMADDGEGGEDRRRKVSGVVAELGGEEN